MDNDFELLILRSVQKNRPVMFTMDDCKVYIGWVIRAPHPTEHRKSIRLLPLASGFRDSITRTVELTTDYVGAIESIMSDDDMDSNHLTFEDFEVVLPVDKIASSHPFDFSAYEHFQQKDGDENGTALLEQNESEADGENTQPGDDGKPPNSDEAEAQ